MTSGRVKWFDSKKGYGFITEEESGKDVFLHVSALEKSKLRSIKLVIIPRSIVINPYIGSLIILSFLYEIIEQITYFVFIFV